MGLKSNAIRIYDKLFNEEICSTLIYMKQNLSQAIANNVKSDNSIMSKTACI